MLPRLDAVLEGRAVSCALRLSGRARRPGLWCAPETGLVVTAPQGTPQPQVRAFLSQHRRWILRQMARLNGHADLPRRWPYGPALLYRGQVLYDAKQDPAGAIRSWDSTIPEWTAGSL